MSMFRRPTDDSSDSDSSSEASETEELEHSHASTEDITGADLTRTRTLSSGESISVGHGRDETNFNDVNHVRNMLLASLLEDFYRMRAAELFNAANPGSNCHRKSPEIQPLARRLFDQASQAMTSNGLLPNSVVSDEVENARGQYLAGLDNLGLQNIQDSDLLPHAMKRRISAAEHSLVLVKAHTITTATATGTSDHPIRDLALRTERLSIVPHPTNDMQISSTQSIRSHYKSSFQEMQLLGRGGFGRVYHTYNVFDKKEYAVKKIPLSIKLSQQYREKGHTELASILREVQALAQLDHCNIVRYHATWIEDPTNSYKVANPPIFRTSFNQQKLLADRPTIFPQPQERRRSSAKLLSYGNSDGIVFDADDVQGDDKINPNLGWSQVSHAHQRESSVPDSDIFTDGVTHNIRSDKFVDDPSCYVLHVQMSMYPITLAQYLMPMSSSTRNGTSAPPRRHCFHLMPTLRILLGILCGLQYLHAHGLVHRDIKPSNIFLSSYDAGSRMFSAEGCQNVGACSSCPVQQPYYINPRIGDFGLVADLAQEGETAAGSRGQSGSPVGTEYYRPPIGKGKKVPSIIDEKLDVYALGVVLVEMLWCCGTSMERFNLLKSVQKGNVPQEILASIGAEGHPSDLVNMVEECIRGMIHSEHSARWSCNKSKDRLECILTRCHDNVRSNG